VFGGFVFVFTFLLKNKLNKGQCKFLNHYHQLVGKDFGKTFLSLQRATRPCSMCTAIISHHLGVSSTDVRECMEL
jgi:hypothetical protein